MNFTAASCAGLPSKASCSFNPPSVTGSGDTTLTIKTTAPSAASLSGMTWTTGFGVIFAAVFLLGGASRKPQYRRALFGAVVCACLIGIGACGGGGGNSGPPPDPGTPKGTSTVTITAVSGSLTHSKTISLTVQPGQRSGIGGWSLASNDVRPSHRSVIRVTDLQAGSGDNHIGVVSLIELIIGNS